MSAAERLLAVNARDPEEIRVALAEGARLLDLRWARPDRETRVGDLCLGVVKQVEPGLDAAFVDFGDRRSGFLHVGNVHPGYRDPGADPFAVAASATDAAEAVVGAQDAGEAGAAAGATAGAAAGASPDPGARGNIAELLAPRQRLLVQVLRDPARGKGATLTTYVALAGRLLVLMPSLGRAGVSRRIEDAEERERLRALLSPAAEREQLGLIVRTAAVGAGAEELARDWEHLLWRWRAAGAAGACAGGPGLLLAEESAAVRAVRDLYSGAVARVIADDAAVARDLEQFLVRYRREGAAAVEHYSQSRPLFEALDLERDFQLLFRDRVPLPGGGSIVVHETEALTAIDVNSGRIDQGSLEETARETNRRAAAEIARQVRLRDLGGIVVVDFIDMRSPAYRKELEAEFQAALRADRARVKLGRLGSFGLLPLTRRRQGTGLPRPSERACHHCGGSGNLAAQHAGALRVLRRLRAAPAPGRVRVHPGVAEILRGEHAPALAALGPGHELLADPQVPSGEPVFESGGGS
ncbi:MAG: Rne/Rng family ribonuclease [Planctomycetota bacterium]|nr:MAG: Rne/Rng family ribonuclease [Planctomycetota bacterium]